MAPATFFLYPVGDCSCVHAGELPTHPTEVGAAGQLQNLHLMERVLCGGRSEAAGQRGQGRSPSSFGASACGNNLASNRWRPHPRYLSGSCPVSTLFEARPEGRREEDFAHCLGMVFSVSALLFRIPHHCPSELAFWSAKVNVPCQIESYGDALWTKKITTAPADPQHFLSTKLSWLPLHKPWIAEKRLRTQMGNDSISKKKVGRRRPNRYKVLKKVLNLAEE